MLRGLVAFSVCASALSAVAGMPPAYGVVLWDFLDSVPLTDYAIYPSSHPSIEFLANYNSVDAVVWPRSSGTRYLDVDFQNPMPTAHSAALTVTGAAYTTSLGTTNLTVTPSPSVISFPANGIGSTTLSIQGLPNYVAKGELQITYTLIATGPGGTSLSSDIEVELFLT